ncbi:Fe2OG dioxygenase domain-containing protein [Balamuthia mandrillaris]
MEENSTSNDDGERKGGTPARFFFSGKDLLRLAQLQQQQQQQAFAIREAKAAEEEEEEEDKESVLAAALSADPFLLEHDPFEPLTQEEAEEEDIFAATTTAARALEAVVLGKVFGESLLRTKKRKRSSAASFPPVDGTCFIDELTRELAARVVRFLPFLDKLHLRQASSSWRNHVHGSCPILRRSVKVAALKELAKNFRQGSLFSCGGTSPLTQPLQLFFHSKQGQAEQGTCEYLSFPLVEQRGREGMQTEGEALQELMACCSAATFGRGREEVLDPSYRDALQLSPALFDTNFHVAEYDILDKIKRVIAPRSWRIRAELYKLNIYAAGGHFKAHVDTPRGDGMFGSLVVCLPTSFKGGQLLVRHSGRQVVFPLGGEDEGGDTNGREEEGGGQLRCEVKWAAFYSDCEHEILPVTEGHRITLTYNLYSEPEREPPPGKQRNKVKEQEEKGEEKTTNDKEQNGDGSAQQQALNVGIVRSKLKDLLVDEGCFPEAQLRLHRSHRLPSSQSFLLKGFDAVVQEAAESLGLETSLKCFFAHHQLSRPPWWAAAAPYALLMCDAFPRAISVSDFVVCEGADLDGLTFLLERYPLPLHRLVDAIPFDEAQAHPGWLHRRAERLVELMAGQGFTRGEAQSLLLELVEEAAEEEEERKREEENEDEEEQEQEEEKDRDGMHRLPKKAVQWCTEKPMKARDTLAAVTAAWGNSPCTWGFYVSAVLLVELPSWQQRR